MLRPQLLLLPLVVLLGCGEATQIRAKRLTPAYTVILWNKAEPIPYIIDSGFSPDQKKDIENELEVIKNHTCIDFKEDDGPGLKLEYFPQQVGPGCGQSIVGDSRTLFGENHKVYLSLTCVRKAFITHETMHALGFYHTHQRPDRDEYVIVHTEKISEDDRQLRESYAKMDQNENYTDYGIPYDVHSLMHYEVNEYIELKDADYRNTIKGWRMNFNDWKMVNLHYKCSETCSTPMECLNKGYQHPQCDRCVCPQFYSGERCEVGPETITLTPGENVPIYHEFARDDEAQRAVPFEQYQRATPKLYKAPEGSLIRVTIDSIIDMSYPDGSPCGDSRGIDFVEGDLTTTGKRFCWGESAGHSFLTKSNLVGVAMFAPPGYWFAVNATLEVVDAP